MKKNISSDKKNNQKTSVKEMIQQKLAKKQYADALSAADDLLEKAVHDPELLYLSATAALFLENYAHAFARARELLTQQSFHLGAYMIVATCYKKQKQTAAWRQTLYLLTQAAHALYGENTENQVLSEAWKEIAISALSIGNAREGQQGYLNCSRTETREEEKHRAYSAFLMCTHYDHSYNDQEIFDLHKKYADFFSSIQPFTHEKRRRHKKLRIGYISPDFRNHVVLYFLYPLLHDFDPEAFEIYCYCNCTEDAASAALREEPVRWQNIKDLTASDAANLIYEDQIDILFELAGHTAGNCLPILAFKPAPVQICGIGYFNTTGLPAVDYILTDPWIDPPGQNDSLFTEKLLYLPQSHWCYGKKAAAPPCQPAPFLQKGFITFCCFNNFSKITDDMLCLWQQILEKIPSARLVLKGSIFKDSYGITMTFRRLENLGFHLEQIEFRPDSASYLEEYLDMDIALDTAPYVGGATTCEALYMGVPVITLAGSRHGARFGVSILKNAGLSDCIADSGKEYIEKALQLANDKDRLQRLHSGQLRQQLAASPLMQEKAYMRELERAYKRVWNDYLNKNREPVTAW